MSFPKLDMDAFNDSLKSLQTTKQNKEELSLAARFGPRLKLDANEPFRPQAVGYAIYNHDGPSQSFPRHIRLARFTNAVAAIECAIWWDWDINHLYELEHVWVYINSKGNVVGLEGSWHGSVRRLYRGEQIQTNENNAVVFAAPGKHALGTDIEDFQRHESLVPGLTSRFAGSHGTLQVDMFAGEIPRTPVSDRYVHSYLTRFAFEPSWDFSKELVINETLLVPWAALREWIPGRIDLWLSFLKQEIRPDEYRFLRTAVCSTNDQIKVAGDVGMDMVMMEVVQGRWGVPVVINRLSESRGSNLIAALQACHRARVGVYLVIQEKRSLGWIKRILRFRDWSDYLMTGSSDKDLLEDVKYALPHYRIVYIQHKLSKDSIEQTLRLKASYLHFLSQDAENLTEELIHEAHESNISVIGGPYPESSRLRKLATLSIDVIVGNNPDQFADLDFHNPGDSFIG